MAGLSVVTGSDVDTTFTGLGPSGGQTFDGGPVTGTVAINLQGQITNGLR